MALPNISLRITAGTKAMDTLRAKSSARDRQELGQTLDHAHHSGFQQQHQVHKRGSKNLGGGYRDIRAPLSAHAAFHAFHAAQSAFHRILLVTRPGWIDISPHHSAPIPNAAP
jgi:hypothetical protein